jgi:glycosyl transferase family 87
MPGQGQDRCPCVGAIGVAVPSRARASYLSPLMTSTASIGSSDAAGSPDAPDTRRGRAIDWLVAFVWLATIVAVTLQQGLTHPHNNFLIFRAATRHLFAGADLYAAYPGVHDDFYKYSPTFALLFLPFAYLPLSIAMLAWNALNAGTLFVALGMVLPRRAATVARAIVFLDMLGSLQNVQSNALVAALIIWTFAAYERRHTALGSLAAVAGTFIKLFPLAGVTFALFHPRKLRVAAAVALGVVVFALLPLLVTPPSTLAAQYASWRAIEAKDTLHRGFSVMQMTQLVLHTDWPNWPQQLLGVVLLVAPIIAQPARWREWGFRRLYLASVLVFCVIFNHQAESPTFVIASSGVGIWFASLERRTRWQWALFAFFVVFTMLASSDAMPDAIQRDFFDRYRFKTVPLIVIWIGMQLALWSRKPARELRTAVGGSE